VSVLSFLLGVISSSRANDAKSAQGIALVIIFPVYALIAIQMTGMMLFTPILLLLLVLFLCLLNILVLRLAVRLFRRESIIVRWK
jgi:ABC-2 type transport system permease protein